MKAERLQRAKSYKGRAAKGLENGWSQLPEELKSSCAVTTKVASTAVNTGSWVLGHCHPELRFPSSKRGTFSVVTVSD